MDYCFPTDSNVLNDRHVDTCVYGNLDCIKRCTLIEHTLADNLYEFKFEEKSPTGDPKKHVFVLLDYYCKWLESLGNYKAKNLSDSIKN